MGRILLAFKAFFRTLGNRRFADGVRSLIDRAAAGQPLLPQQPPPATVKPAEPPKKPKPARNDALNLLAALQREARFVDFIKEPIDGYADAQIGAAVRDVHRDCGAVLERMFALKPIADAAEGATIEVPEGFDAVRYRLTGNVAGKAPFRGTVCHHGWQAARCELPEWTGGEAAQTIVAPIEVEVK